MEYTWEKTEEMSGLMYVNKKSTRKCVVPSGTQMIYFRLSFQDQVQLNLWAYHCLCIKRHSACGKQKGCKEKITRRLVNVNDKPGRVHKQKSVQQQVLAPQKYNIYKIIFNKQPKLEQSRTYPWALIKVVSDTETMNRHNNLVRDRSKKTGYN